MEHLSTVAKIGYAAVAAAIALAILWVFRTIGASSIEWLAPVAGATVAEQIALKFGPELLAAVGGLIGSVSAFVHYTRVGETTPHDADETEDGESSNRRAGKAKSS